MADSEKKKKVCGVGGCKKKIGSELASKLKKRRLDWMNENNIPDLWGVDCYPYLCISHWPDFMDQIIKYKNAMTLHMKQDAELDKRVRTLLCEICGDLKEFDGVLKKE
jgi:hypothetical protein